MTNNKQKVPSGEKNEKFVEMVEQLVGRKYLNDGPNVEKSVWTLDFNR